MGTRGETKQNVHNSRAPSRPQAQFAYESEPKAVMKNLKVCASLIAIGWLASVSPGWETPASTEIHGTTFSSVQVQRDREAFSLTLNPARVTGSKIAVGTVTLTAGPATKTIIISLSGNDPKIGLVPASVQIEAGRASANFTVRTVAVSTTSDLKITAALGLQTKTITLTVEPPTPPKVESVTFTGPVTGKVTLTGPAPSNGVVVSLSTTGPAATVPAQLQIVGGSAQGTFTITLHPGSVPAVVKIIADYYTYSPPLTVPPAALSLVLKASSVFGGNRISATVSLPSPAGSNGAVVALTSSNQTVASVPGFAQVPAGAIQASFDVTTLAVADGVNVSIGASYASQSKTAPLQIKCPQLESLRFDRTSVTGGETVTATVTLADAQTLAPTGGLPLRCMVPAASGYTWMSVTVPAGAHQVSFTFPTYPVAQQITPYLEADYHPGQGAGVTFVAQAHLTVNPPGVKDLVFNPASASYQAGTVDGIVNLTGAAAAGTSVLLSWTSTAPATVPPSVSVPAGATSVSFKVNLKQVTAPTPFTLSAYYGGVTKSATLTVNP
jgi:hypothetical protein